MVPEISFILCTISFHTLFCFQTFTVVVGLCIVMACQGLPSKDCCSRVPAGLLMYYSETGRKMEEKELLGQVQMK